MLSSQIIFGAVLSLSPMMKAGENSVMSVTRSAPGQLVLTSGPTTLTLEKDVDKATLQRKLLFWKLTPAETLLTNIVNVTVDSAVDRASGVEVCHTMLIMRTGEGWAFPAADNQDAQTKAKAIRDFLGIAA
jgi:hypothetical protein